MRNHIWKPFVPPPYAERILCFVNSVSSYLAAIEAFAVRFISVEVFDLLCPILPFFPL